MKPPSATVDITVEFEDVDAYRIVHHSKLVCYLERARLRLLDSLDLPTGPAGRTYPVMYDLKVRFHRPARLLDRLAVTAEVGDVDDFRVELKYRVRREGYLLVRASTSIAFRDAESGTSAPVPRKFLERLEERR